MLFKKKRSLLVIPVLFCLLISLSGCEALRAVLLGPSKITWTPPPPSGAYLLKLADPIHIQFGGTTDLQPLDIEIDENGEIGLLYIKERVRAAGLTTSQLEEKIKSLYSEGDIYPSISVNVTMTAKYFYVQGEVNNKQGNFTLILGTTMRQAIYAAGGYGTFADKKRVTITREGKIYTIDMRDIDRDPSLDFPIEVGDVIFVPEKLY
ncbi:MAG: SLBB domain-containing protein [Pontiellaceae bacterium]|nr:SLBB domain-containing protein [Pontiellaceae bacterium]